MFAGVGEAALLAVQYMIATVGAACIGLWAADNDANIIIAVIALAGGVLFSYANFLLGIISLIGLIVSWKSCRYRLDALFVMYVCNVLIAYRLGFSSLMCTLRLIAVLLLPLTFYLLVRIPLWIFLVRQIRERVDAEDDEEFVPEFVLCPECGARILKGESGDIPESCALCGCESLH
jgi:ABC-type dipeptide/oligopeptide/nickel transport system permease component